MNTCPVETYQDPKEMACLIELFRETRSTAVLEIGSLYGGTLWQWMQEIKQKGRLVSIDLPVEPTDYRYAEVMEARSLWSNWAKDADVRLVTVIGDSTKPSIIQEAEKYAPYDLIFIDGGHDYRTVDQDFRNYWPFVRIGGLIALHDISYLDVNRPFMIDVGRWWRDHVNELKGLGTTHEFQFATPNTWGIGVLRKEKLCIARSLS